MKVMRNQEARSKLQENSVRIAQDLTRRQASQLRDLKQVGKSGYFVGGKLCVRDQANTGTTGRWAEGFPNRKSHDAKGGNQNQPTSSADERVNAGARTPTRDVTERPVNRGQVQSVSEAGNTPYVTETPSGPCLRERKTGGGKGRGPHSPSQRATGSGKPACTSRGTAVLPVPQHAKIPTLRNDGEANASTQRATPIHTHRHTHTQM
ncbi:hypothetical protein ACOMHN_037355 [Nucella lapillus]